MNTEPLVTEQHHLFSLMAQVERRYRTYLKECLAPLELSVREYEVLLVVHREGAASPASIARSASVTRQLIHRLLLDLELNRPGISGGSKEGEAGANGNREEVPEGAEGARGEAGA
jgi:hypothetical protein